MTDADRDIISRRRVLKATGASATALAFVGTGQANEGCGGGHGRTKQCRYTSLATAGEGHGGGGSHDEEEHSDALQEIMCPDHPHATTGPGHTMHHVNAGMSACPYGTGLDEDTDGGCTQDDWPDCTDWPAETKALVKESRAALTSAYEDVGTLIAQGYIPYFDVVSPGATGGVSHWLNPEYINDGHYEPEPIRPDAIIMDNMWWNPIGPMYIATKEGEVVWADEEEEIMEVREAWGYENDCGECFPFHPHDGVPGRFAWWYYRQVHEADYASGDPEDLTLPCYTAPMMHAWIYPTPDGPHAATAGAPPPEYRPGGPPSRPGYPTPAIPGQDRLSLEVLPGAVREQAMPPRLERELHVIADLSTETLETATIAELKQIVTDRLGPGGDGLRTD